jgi:hypothetical protein
MRTSVAIALLVLAAACGKKTNHDDKASEKPTTTAAAPAADRATNGDPVDTCALVPKDKLEAIVGPIGGRYEPDMPARGSVLGTCTGVAQKGSVAISARPAAEWDKDVKSATDGHDVANLGEKAFMTSHALLVQPAGKPYYLRIGFVTAGSGKPDEAISTEIAKLALDGAK